MKAAASFISNERDNAFPFSFTAFTERRTCMLCFMFILVVITLSLSAIQPFHNKVTVEYKTIYNNGKSSSQHRVHHTGTYSKDIKYHEGLPYLDVTIVPFESLQKIYKIPSNMTMETFHMTIKGGWPRDNTGMHLFCCIATIISIYIKTNRLSRYTKVGMWIVMTIFWIVTVVLDSIVLDSWSRLMVSHGDFTKDEMEILRNSFEPPLDSTQIGVLRNASTVHRYMGNYIALATLAGICLLSVIMVAWLGFKDDLDEDLNFDDPLYEEENYSLRRLGSYTSL